MHWLDFYNDYCLSDIITNKFKVMARLISKCVSSLSSVWLIITDGFINTFDDRLGGIGNQTVSVGFPRSYDYTFDFYQ